LQFAAEEARLRGGELHVVHAWIDSLTVAGDAAAGVRVRAQAVEGVEWDVLSEAAEAADLLVVGSRGLTGWASLLLGSVGLRVLSHAPCPVAVVRPSVAAG
jgi:nucleotide-binding universal stress UspA family protein